jgi:hypothetical protein
MSFTDLQLTVDTDARAYVGTYDLVLTAEFTNSQGVAMTDSADLSLEMDTLSCSVEVITADPRLI